MKATFKQADLLKALAKLKPAVEKKCAIPILSAVHIDCNSDGEVEFTATDLEIGIKVVLKAGDGFEIGEAVILHRPLVDAAKALKGEVTIEATSKLPVEREDEPHGNNLHVEGEACAMASEPPESDKHRARYCSCGEQKKRDEAKEKWFKASLHSAGGSIGLEAHDPWEWPALPEFPADGLMSVPEGFAEAIGKIMFAVTTDESRFPLAGALIMSAEGQAVATDGHRLALADFPPVTEKALERFVLPKATAAVLVGFAKDKKDPSRPMIMAVKDKHTFVLCTGGERVISRVVDDQFPVYEKVIPQSQANATVAFETVPTVATLKRIAPLLEEKAGAVRFKANGKVTVEWTKDGRSNWLELEDAMTTKEPLPYVAAPHSDACASRKAACTQDEPSLAHHCDCKASKESQKRERESVVEIGLNAGYLAEGLAFCGDSAVMEWRDNQTQAVFVGAGVKYVLMPMRV